MDNDYRNYSLNMSNFDNKNIPTP